MTGKHGNQSFDEALEAALDGRKTPFETLDEEDREILALASGLAESDFSAVYGERAALRRRLLNQHGESRQVWSSESSIGGKVTMFTNRRQPVMAVVALIVVGVLAFARFSPALAESRQGVATWLRTAGVPEQAVVVVAGPPAVAVIRSQDGSMQTLTFRNVSSVEEAQAAANFAVRQPTILPDGFALKSVAISPAGNRVVLAYENSSGNMVFSLRQTTVAPAAGAVPPKDDIIVHLRSGADIPANVIRWEANGVYYELSGTLSKADLQVIADSVQ